MREFLPASAKRDDRAPLTVGWRFGGAVLGASAFAHALAIPSPGCEFDLNAFAGWMRISVEHGAARIAEHGWTDYPPLYLYGLQAIGSVWIALTGQDLPVDGSAALQALLKLTPVLANLVCAAVLFGIARRNSESRTATWVLVAAAFNPALWFNSAVWGQVDSLLCLLVLLSAWALGARRPALAGALSMLALATKLQAIVMAPAFVLFAVQTGGVAALVRLVLGAVPILLLAFAPYAWAGTLDALLGEMSRATSRYPYVSMNAHNFWWLFFGEAAPQTSDAQAFADGRLTYHQLGLLFLATATGLTLIKMSVLLWRREREPLAILIDACAALGLAFYLFPTQIHERYIVPALVFLAARCIWSRRGWWVYGLATIGTFASLAATLESAYPGSSWWPAELFTARWDLAVASVALMATFPLVLLSGIDGRLRLSLAGLALGSIVVVGGLAALPAGTWGGPDAPPSLAEWEPVEVSQAWGRWRRDATVDGAPLDLGGVRYQRGIGTHARSYLRYRLNRSYRRFESDFGITDGLDWGQKLQFRVFGDDELLFDSGVVTYDDLPRRVAVDIEGVEYLVLEVLDGGDGIDGDHAAWLDPHLTR